MELQDFFFFFEMEILWNRNVVLIRINSRQVEGGIRLLDIWYGYLSCLCNWHQRNEADQVETGGPQSKLIYFSTQLSCQKKKIACLDNVSLTFGRGVTLEGVFLSTLSCLSQMVLRERRLPRKPLRQTMTLPCSVQTCCPQLHHCPNAAG